LQRVRACPYLLLKLLPNGDACHFIKAQALESDTALKPLQTFTHSGLLPAFRK